MLLTNIGIVLVLSIKFSRGLSLNDPIPGPKSYNDKIGIVGAGPAGIHMALLLKQKGFKSVEVLESSDRIGGKSYTIMHRNVPHEMGTCYLSPDYDTNIIPLVNKYVPGDLIELVTGSVTLDENLQFLNFNLYAGGYVGRLLNTTNPATIISNIVDSMRRYIGLHKSLLGEYDGEIPPEPSPEVNAQISGTFMEFLARENLLALVPFFEGAHVIQGYGLLDEIPTLYGLIWNTPKFITSLMARLTGNSSTKDSGLSLLKNGFQNLWEKIVEAEDITIYLNTKVTRLVRQTVSKDSNSYKSIISTQNTKTNSYEDRSYDFMIWTPEMKESLPLWGNQFEKEVEYFSKTDIHYFTTAIIDTINETRSISPIIYFLKSNHSEIYDNRVIAQRDSYSAINEFTGPLYQNATYPMSKDNSSFMTTVNYIMAKTKQSKTELIRKFTEQKQHLKANLALIFRMEQWRYFPRYSEEDMESGILWRILELQGKYGMWYTGSSVCFESVKSVVEYNKILVSNMKNITTARSIFDIRHLIELKRLLLSRIFKILNLYYS